MNRQFVIWAISGTLLLGVTGVIVATAQPRGGRTFIPGGQPVTEEQIRQELVSERYSNVQSVRKGHFFATTGLKDGRTTNVVVDPQNGRLVDDDDDGD
jgi:hypothetical protein